MTAHAFVMQSAWYCGHDAVVYCRVCAKYLWYVSVFESRFTHCLDTLNWFSVREMLLLALSKSGVKLKHEEGYFEGANDWEYVRMINDDPTVDFTGNPNGWLENASVSGNSSVPACAGCHNGADGGDQIFSND